LTDLFPAIDVPFVDYGKLQSVRMYAVLCCVALLCFDLICL